MKKNFFGTLVWIISTSFVIYSFCLSLTTAFLAEHISLSLHISDIHISLAIGSFIFGFALMQIPAGYILDRFNIHWGMSGAILLVILCNILISHAENLLVFCFANFFQGVGGSFAFIATGILITEWFSVAMFPILIGLTETIATITAALLGYVFVLELDYYSWQQIYSALAIFGSFILILTLIFVRSPRDYHRTRPVSFKISFIAVTNNRQIWLCTLAAALSFGVLLAYADLWYVRVQQFYSVSVKETALIGSMFYLGIGIGTPLLGWISNLMKSRKLVLHITLVIGNMLLLLALYLPHFPIETLIIIKIISFLTGFFLSGSMLFYTVVKEDSPLGARGLALSIINTAVFLFDSIMLLIPYIFVTSISTQFFTYLWILPFCVMISILLLYFMRESFQSL